MFPLESGMWVCVRFGAEPPIVCLAQVVNVATQDGRWWFDTYVGPGEPSRLMFHESEVLGVPVYGMTHVGVRAEIAEQLERKWQHDQP